MTTKTFLVHPVIQIHPFARETKVFKVYFIIGQEVACAEVTCQILSPKQQEFTQMYSSITGEKYLLNSEDVVDKYGDLHELNKRGNNVGPNYRGCVSDSNTSRRNGKRARIILCCELMSGIVNLISPSPPNIQSTAITTSSSRTQQVGQRTPSLTNPVTPQRMPAMSSFGDEAKRKLEDFEGHKREAEKSQQQMKKGMKTVLDITENLEGKTRKLGEDFEGHKREAEKSQQQMKKGMKTVLDITENLEGKTRKLGEDFEGHKREAEKSQQQMKQDFAELFNRLENLEMQAGTDKPMAMEIDE